jgi:hypothetical protein
MSSGRALGAGAGELDRGRKLRGDDCGRRRLQRESKRTQAGHTAERIQARVRNQTNPRATPRMAVAGCDGQ